MRTPRRSLAAISIAALALVGCADGVSSSRAATVDGTDIPRAQLEEAVTTVTETTGSIDGAAAEERAAVVAPLQRQLLSLLVQARIIEDVANERGIEIDEQSIADQIESDTEELGGEEEFAEVLAQSQLTLPIYRDVLLPAQQRVEAIRASLQEDLPDTEVRTVRHILVEDAAEAEEIVDLLEGGADFAELAAERSIDTGSGAQGDLGPAPRGSYVGGFEDAVWDAELDTIVGPVETEFGFHILEVTDEGTLSADEQGPAAQAPAVDAELSELLQASFGAADVSVDPAFGTWDSELGEVVEGDPPGIERLIQMADRERRIVLIETSAALPGLLPFQAWDALAMADEVLVRDAERHPSGPYLYGAGLDLVTVAPATLDRGDLDLTRPGSADDRRLAKALVSRVLDGTTPAFLLGPEDDGLAKALAGMSADPDIEIELVFLAPVPPGTEVLRLTDIMRQLRDPQTGCPWDLEQDHASLVRHLLEETYELVDAIEREQDVDLVEELGDVLLQVVFHAQVAQDRRAFGIDDVARGIADKLVRRHPHVFGDGDAATAEDVQANWDRQKADEKGRTGPFDGFRRSWPG